MMRLGNIGELETPLLRLRSGEIRHAIHNARHAVLKQRPKLLANPEVANDIPA